MKLDFDPKVFFGIIAVVVVGVAFLIYRGVTYQPLAPLPDAKMFVKTAPTAPPAASTPSASPSN
jgi:hypothetical protein